MKKQILAIFIASQWSAIILAGQPSAPEAPPHVMKRVSMEDVVYELQFVYKIPIHFEEVPIDMEKQPGISAEERLKELESLEPSSLTDGEKSFLNLLRRDKERLKGQRVGFKKRRFNISLPPKGADPTEILNLLIQKDPDYTWKKTNTSFIVHPKKPVDRPRIKSFILQDSNYPSARKKFMEEVLAPSKLEWGDIMSGPIRSDGSDFYDSFRFNLNLSDVDVYTALTRFCECMGPNAIWTITGLTGTDGVHEFGISFIQPED